MSSNLVIHYLGLTDFGTTCLAMQAFTAERTSQTSDELWITEHPPVYTLGLNRKGVRMPSRNDIPVVNTDRGGKITYHGPGQLVIYCLIDLKRKGLNVRQLVSAIENSIVQLLAEFNISAEARVDAPGVYVADKKNGKARKIASLGLRLKNQSCYHGLSLNVDMDLSPFNAIDPCGYQGLEVTQTKDLGIHLSLSDIAEKLVPYLHRQLNY